MKNFKNNIDELVNKILNEEIETKVKQLSEQVEEEWKEIETKEALVGGQKKLDVAEPKGKLDAADFKKLRDKKKETKEEEESALGDYEGDDEAEQEAEELSQNEPTYVGKGLEDNKMKADMKNKIFGSFSDDHGWYNQDDQDFEGEFNFDYDEEVFDDFQSMYDKFGDKTRWFSPGDRGQRMFDIYKQKYGPMKIRVRKGMEEQAETDEGNAFTGALAKAKEDGKDSFEVDGKKFHVKEAKEKWIQKTDMKKGALHKKLGVPEGDKIPQAKLKSLKKELMKKAEGDKKLSAADLKLLKQVNLALTLKGIKESQNSLQLTENELIDLIEKLVIEQKVKDIDEKDNISKKEPEGLKKTNKALDASKKENDDYAKSVVKKMKDYVKAGTKGQFEENPENFPESNYTLEKKPNVKKYMPSDAVEEYIEYFSYPGQTNLVFDEIKPDDKQIEKYLKGDSTTGNAVKSKDGKALGNVVPSEVGEKFMQNYEDNVYGQEQMKASYKRQPMPVETAGENTTAGSLKSKKAYDKGKAVLDKLEETKKDKKEAIISEEMNKMKNLISYNRKTQ